MSTLLLGLLSCAPGDVEDLGVAHLYRAEGFCPSSGLVEDFTLAPFDAIVFIEICTEGNELECAGTGSGWRNRDGALTFNCPYASSWRAAWLAPADADE